MPISRALLMGLPGLAALGLLWCLTRQPKQSTQPPTPPASPVIQSTPAASPHSEGTRPSEDVPTVNPTPPPPTVRTSDRSPAPPAVRPGVPTPPEVAPLAPGEPADIQSQLDAVHFMLRDYRSLTGENPVGTNAEIMKAMMGGNPRQATLGPPPGQRLNADGELLDPWGKPYFFHQLSGREMEIRSAGPR